MKRKILIFILISIAILCAGIFFITKYTPQEESPEIVTAYIREHISELSPQKEVLGGTFYVTSITAYNGKGFVEYEDGHIALKASFTYTTDNGVTITSFIPQND